MKKVLLFAIVLLTVAVAANAQKKEKKEKAPKNYEWTWDGTKSGNEAVDNYLLTVDTLWNQIKDYQADQEKYSYQDTLLVINDKVYKLAYMVTKEGGLVTRGTCNWQLVNSIATGIKLGSQALKAGAMEATAATALPKLGLKAMNSTKYLKGGVNIISMAKDEISRVVSIQKANAKDWKSLKTGALTEEELAAIVDKDGNRVFDDEAIKNMKRCTYVTLLEEADPLRQVALEKVVGKSEAEQKTEIDNIVAAMKAPVAPEDENKVLSEVPDDDQLL